MTRHARQKGAGRATHFLKRLDAAWKEIARRRFLSCALVFTLCLVLRLALLPLDPKPVPKIQDEFSYILGGETLAKGRLANPTHPMWRFFETYHVNMQPTYVSKYPPGQAIFLALGIRLFGHPWYGVAISVALMCGSICWMLQGWVPPEYALLGGLLAVLQFTTHYWMDSYWGGAVAALGGALVIGALPRLARNGKPSVACVSAAGVAILANSRPYEGLILTVITSGALLWWTRGHFYVWLRPKVVAPFAIVLCVAGIAMAYYNLKTTGGAITFPYSINQQRYSASPLLWILPPYPPAQREYRDPSMRALWETWDVGYYTRVRHNPSLSIFHLYEAFNDLRGPDVGMILLFLCAAALPLYSVPRLRLILGIIVFLSVGMAMVKYTYAHYLAPGLGAFFLVAMFGARFLRCHRLGRVAGLGLLASITGLGIVLFVFNTVGKLHDHDAGSGSVLEFRNEVNKKLASEAGRHLVFVHYAPEHNFHEELVYNGPDIDTQKVVWAFDFGPSKDRLLEEYYKGREVWLIQPDLPHATLARFPHTDSDTAELIYGKSLEAIPRK